MIRATLLTLALVAAASGGPAFAAFRGDVITIDHGPGHNLVIIRGAGSRSGWSTDQREVLDYTDGSGVPVRVYADHPISRDEVEAELRHADQERRFAQREAANAQREGARAHYEAGRERIEALREAQTARYEAAQARAEPLARAY